MIDGVLIFMGGFLGSSHCVGMCGAFALALGSKQARLGRSAGRQLVYCLGRVSTYASGGAMAGFAGARLAIQLPAFVRIQAILCIVAGALLIWQGLAAAGLLGRASVGGNRNCLVPTFFSALLAATRLRSVFFAGAVNGLLPCGLVYAYLALAATSTTMWAGALVMTLFGLGTIPVLVAVGLGGTFVSHALRFRVLRVAAWFVILTGLISLVRGITFLQSVAPSVEQACPFCS